VNEDIMTPPTEEERLANVAAEADEAGAESGLSELQQQNMATLTRLSQQGFDVEAFVSRLRCEVLIGTLLPDGPFRAIFENVFQQNLQQHLAEQEQAIMRSQLTAGVATNIPKDALPPGMGIAK